MLIVHRPSFVRGIKLASALETCQLTEMYNCLPRFSPCCSIPLPTSFQSRAPLSVYSGMNSQSLYTSIFCHPPFFYSLRSSTAPKFTDISALNHTFTHTFPPPLSGPPSSSYLSPLPRQKGENSQTTYQQDHISSYSTAGARGAGVACGSSLSLPC